MTYREAIAIPEYAALVAGLRAERAGDITSRLVTADWFDEHDQHERAEFIRFMCEGKPAVFHMPGRNAKLWFGVGDRAPNTANIMGDWLRFFPMDTEGTAVGPEGAVKLELGFMTRVQGEVAFVLKHLDELYAREPIAEVTTRGRLAPESGGRPTIDHLRHDRKYNTRVYFVAGREVTVPEIEVYHKPDYYTADREKALAESVFAHRWPGVKFTCTGM